LRDQREIAGDGIPRREAGVELRRRRHDAKAVRSDKAKPVLARLDPRRLSERRLPVAEPGGDDHGGAGALSAGAGDDPGHGRGRRGDDDEIRNRRQILDPRGARLAVDLAVFRVDEQDRTRESRLP